MDTTVQLDERGMMKGRWRRGKREKRRERRKGKRRRGGKGREGRGKGGGQEGEKKGGEAEVLLTMIVLFLNSSMIHDLPTSCPAPLQRQRDQLCTFFSFSTVQVLSIFINDSALPSVCYIVIYMIWVG